MTELKEGKPEEYISTRRAAQMLGVSLGTVQNMVESGRLPAWKTAGGHRRIPLDAVRKLLGRAHLSAQDEQGIAVLVAEDDPATQMLYRLTFEAWDLPVSLEIVGNGIDALVRVGKAPPDVLIADLNMPGLDGFEMVHRLRANRRFSDMDIIVVTGLDEAHIAQRGGLPAGIAVYAKPIPFHELHGFLKARVVERQRLAREAE